MKYVSIKYVRLIFGGKVLNYERQVRFFQFLIYRKLIESCLEGLNCTCVTILAEEQEKKKWMDEKLFSLSTTKAYFVHCLGSERRRILGLKENLYLRKE